MPGGSRGGRLELERKKLLNDMVCLEMSDDFLFTNVNGNLPSYEKMRSRVWAIGEELEAMRCRDE